MIRLIFAALMAVVIAISQASCAIPGKRANPRTMSFSQLQFSISKSERFELANGMVVYLMINHELPMVGLTAYIGCGSIYEPDDKVGLAALAGAVMRTGGTSELSPADLNAELEFMASSVESSIGSDVANISMSTLTKNLDRAMELFGQIMMHPRFDKNQFELATKQTIEGIRRQNDDPKRIANREISKALYAGHALGRVPSIETVKAIRRDDLISFHHAYFVPNNVILAVAGDIDRDQLRAILEKVFGGWERRQVVFPHMAEPAASITPEILYVRKDVNQSVIRMGHMGIEKNNPDLYAIRVMDYVLGSGFTSRLTTEVRSNQGLAYNVGSYFDIGRRFIGTFKAETETKAESTIKAIALMRSIINGMTAVPVSDQELSLAKDAIINSFIFGFANPDAAINQQARLEYYGYPSDYLENYRDNIDRVTKDDVLRVARSYLQPDRMVITVVGDRARFDQPLDTLGPPVREIVLGTFNSP